MWYMDFEILRPHKWCTTSDLQHCPKHSHTKPNTFGFVIMIILIVGLFNIIYTSFNIPQSPMILFYTMVQINNEYNSTVRKYTCINGNSKE